MSQFKRIHIKPEALSRDKQGPFIPWYDSQFVNVATPKMNPGEYWCDDVNGNWYQCVRADAALAAGQLVTRPAASLTGTYTAAGSTVSVINTNITTTLSEVGNFIYFTDTAAGGGTPALRQIKAHAIGANTAFTVANIDFSNTSKGRDPDVLSVLPTTNGSAVNVIRPFSVIVCTAALVPCGVALGTVTSGNFTIIQIAGLAQVLAVGTGTALAAGVPCIPSAAGVVIGSAAANQFTAGVSLIPAALYAGSSQLFPIQMNCLGA